MEENFEIDLTEETVAVKKTPAKESPKRSRQEVKPAESVDLESCLRNETVIVKLIPRDNDDPRIDKKHPYFGGVADTAIRQFTVPILTNGSYKNVLTKAEKDFLEDYMGLEYNALSVHKRDNNFWENYSVRLEKMDNIFNLADPKDYIDVKVLLANTDTICPSVSALENNYKATYQFVVTSELETFSNTKTTVNNKMKCYAEIAKIGDNFDVLSSVVEMVEGRAVSKTSTIDFVKSKVLGLMETDTKALLNALTDPTLQYRVILNKAIERKIVTRKGDFHYYDGEPLCGDGQNPTATYAAKYLSLPANQEIYLAIKAKLAQYE